VQSTQGQAGAKRRQVDVQNNGPWVSYPALGYGSPGPLPGRKMYYVGLAFDFHTLLRNNLTDNVKSASIQLVNYSSPARVMARMTEVGTRI